MTVFDALREARIAAGLSQADVAKLLGIAPSYLSDIEHGRRQFLDKYLELLPEPIRGPVAKAMLPEARLRVSYIEKFHVEC